MDVQELMEDPRGAVRDAVSGLTAHTGMPSASPILGLPIPIRRAIPMDVHSVLDYGNAAECLALGAMASVPAAKLANTFIGLKGLGLSIVTDYRLSLAKLVPIEVHELGDHLFGLSAITTPFLLGYWKKEPVITAMQVMCGVTTIVAALFTDYRAQRGVKWGLPIVRRGNR